MLKVVNPLNREKDIDTAANITICDCICYSDGDNHNNGRTDSRWSGNLVCGCACQTDNDDNKGKNDYKDDSR